VRTPQSGDPGAMPPEIFFELYMQISTFWWLWDNLSNFEGKKYSRAPVFLLGAGPLAP